MKTLRTLKSDLSLILWPSGEAVNLIPGHSAFFVRALMDLQNCCSMLRTNNRTVVRFDATLFDCGLTVLPAPRGLIKRVYTIANLDGCTKVDYWWREYDELLCYQETLKNWWTAPSQTRSVTSRVVINDTDTTLVTNTVLPAPSPGLAYPGVAADYSGGRAQTGIWALDRNRIYIGPWIQSNEQVEILWDGVKPDWSDDDQLDLIYWTPREEMAIQAYVRWQHEVNYGSCTQQEKEGMKQDWFDARADCIQDNDSAIRRQIATFCPDVLLTQANMDAEAVPATPTDTVDAFVGNMGNNANTLAVIALIDGWSVNRFVTGGNNIDSSAYITTLDAQLKDYSDADKLKFGFAENDWTYDTTLANLIEWAKLPGRYYDFVSGNVHYFVVSTDYTQEADLNFASATVSAEASVEGQWLKNRLALSTAMYKVVVMPNAPYASKAFPIAADRTVLRWPFGDWGADLVLSGITSRYNADGGYERITISHLPYVVVATGGLTIGSFTSPITGSQIRSSSFGALKITSSTERLLCEFFSTAGILIDSLEIIRQ